MNGMSDEAAPGGRTRGGLDSLCCDRRQEQFFRYSGGGARPPTLHAQPFYPFRYGFGTDQGTFITSC